MNKAAQQLGRMAKGVKKTMSAEATAQRQNAIKSRWKKHKAEAEKAIVKWKRRQNKLAVK